MKRVFGSATADDLVHRKFHRLAPNELWVTDITEHPTREGKVYCCAVMDTFSRKIVGWSIDSSQDTHLVVNALDMAITARRPRANGAVVAQTLNSVSVGLIHQVATREEYLERVGLAIELLARDFPRSPAWF